jgi:hypothetical protein
MELHTTVIALVRPRWRRSAWLPAVVIAANLALLASAEAASVSMSISAAPEIKEGVLQTEVTLRTAHSVTTVLKFKHLNIHGPAQVALPPKKTAEFSLSQHVGDVAAGRWPYHLVVSYADANQYPFQAIHLGLVTVGAPPPAKVVVTDFESEPIDQDGRVQFRC